MERPKRKAYSTVMPRVYNRSQSSLHSLYSVTNHSNSETRLNKDSITELPTVLHGYIPSDLPPKRSVVVKPKRTIKSLNPNKSSLAVNEQRDLNVFTTIKDQYRRVIPKTKYATTDTLKKLQDEIDAYRKKDKFMHLRNRLYKSCGVVLDEKGQVTQDQTVQTEIVQPESEDLKLRFFYGFRNCVAGPSLENSPEDNVILLYPKGYC